MLLSRDQLSKYDDTKERLVSRKSAGSFRWAMIWCAVLMLCMTVTSNAAESIRYVNDYLIINLRSGAGDQFRILRTLPTGTRLRVLEQKGDFLRVVTDDKLEGWVLGQYLRDTPAARDQLASVQSQYDKASSELTVANAELKQLTEAHQQLQAHASELQSKLETLTKDHQQLLVVAGRPMEIEQENVRLQKLATTSEAVRVRVEAENDDLRASTAQKWFAAGGGVLVLGILVGIILPRLRRRRQSGWA